MSAVLVTGAAGFIGSFVAGRLLDSGCDVVGIDNLNDYYDPSLKQARLERLAGPSFTFLKLDLADRAALEKAFQERSMERVIHLAAQPGVRYSLVNPYAYVQSNLVGFSNLLECCRHGDVKHLVFASSSSVYGANTALPYSVQDNVDHPVSLYAATKKSNELMAHAYSHLSGLPVTGLRFFTVYGPWGRPDMAYFKFVKAIIEDRRIDVYNEGRMSRDFTYVDDIVEGVVRLLERPAEPSSEWSGKTPDPATSLAPYRLFNIGNNQPVSLMDFIRTIEKALGKKARLNLMPMQSGDVENTHADVSALERCLGFSPSTSLEEGVARFVDWYRDYYRV